MEVQPLEAGTRNLRFIFFVCFALLTPLRSFANSWAIYTSFFYNSKVTSSFDYKKQEFKRDGLSGMLGYEGLYDSGLISGGGVFIGGGALGSDIGEFILGGDLKKQFWLLEDKIAMPISLDVAWRIQKAYMKNMLIAAFIDEPKFLWESEEYLNDKRDITRYNFDIMPSIDLQFFLGSSISFYVGYMYRITYSTDWTFNYEIPEKNYIDEKGNKKAADSFKVPEEFNPMKDSKEQIFGIPGTLRFGIKFYGGSL